MPSNAATRRGGWIGASGHRARPRNAGDDDEKKSRFILVMIPHSYPTECVPSPSKFCPHLKTVTIALTLKVIGVRAEMCCESAGSQRWFELKKPRKCLEQSSAHNVSKTLSFVSTLMVYCLLLRTFYVFGQLRASLKLVKPTGLAGLAKYS